MKDYKVKEVVLYKLQDMVLLRNKIQRILQRCNVKWETKY